MATDKKISTLVESQVPGFLHEEGPNLVAFLKAYYEWMETSGQVTDASRSLLENQDIDSTDLSKFYGYFQKEILSDFPDAIVADRRLVAKRITDLYRSKGSAAAYNLLFRILYDQDVSIYKPSENILRASDGRWTQDTVVRLGQPFAGNLEEAVGRVITGESSKARGKVLKVLTVFESGVEVKQLRLTEVTGTFLDLEKVVTPSGLSGFVVNTVGPLKDVNLGSLSTVGGTGHQTGDSVTFTSATGIGATGVVDTTTNEVVTYELIDGGSGYAFGNTTVLVSGGEVNLGQTGSVSITGITNNEIFFAYTDTIRELSDTPIGYGPTYSSNSGILSANLASSNSSSALNSALATITVSAGSISSISFTNGNYANNSLPSVSIVDSTITRLDVPDGNGGFAGRNAVVRPSFIPGSITNVIVNDGGRLYNAIDSVTVTNTSRAGTTDAIGDPVVSGVIAEAGNYKGTKGFLSWDQRLQDNYYYQEFSYVLRSQKALKTYRNIVRDIIHPAGTKLFGQVDIEVSADLTGLDVETLVTTDLIGGKFGIGSIGPLAVFGDITLSRDAFIPSTEPTLAFGSTALYLPANGFIHVSINNIITPYLGLPITSYLNEPVLYGTDFVVQGDGTTPFTTILQGGTQVQIEDIVPGTSGNLGDGVSTYIVNTVFSNTAFSLNSRFTGALPGDGMSNGVFLYSYNGNV